MLENSKVCVFIRTKGGSLTRAFLKGYKAYGDTVSPLCLFRGDETSTSFTLITQNNRIISTANLYFVPVVQKQDTIVMRLQTAQEEAWLDFVYTLAPDDYMLRFSIEPHNMQYVLAQNVNSAEMPQEVSVMHPSITFRPSARA